MAGCDLSALLWSAFLPRLGVKDVPSIIESSMLTRVQRTGVTLLAELGCTSLKVEVPH